MEYANISNVNLPVSRVLFGTAMPLMLGGGDANSLLDEMLALGINTFDCARVYGSAERSLGNWIASRKNREKVVILSKCGHPTPMGRKRVNEKAMRKDLCKSLRELGTDYIDIYLLHRDDPAVPVGEIVEIFNAMHNEGKIGAFGGSNWSHQRIAAANAYASAHGLIPFTASSPNFGLTDQVQDPWGGGCVTISGPANADSRDWYRETGMPIIAYSSLGHGFFSGKLKSSDADNAKNILDGPGMKGYACPENFERLRRCEELAAQKGVTVPQLAMAWLLRQQLNTFAVVSSARPERMKENIAALDIPLTPDEIRWLDLQ